MPGQRAGAPTPYFLSQTHFILSIGVQYNLESVPPQFEILEHPADVGFLAYGATLEELFANAALAMMSLACELQAVEEKESRAIEASAGDKESLLFAWLAEILGVADGEQLVFCRAKVTAISDQHVTGMVYGEKFDKTRHHAGTYIKAVTLHQFRIDRSTAGWRAQVYLDV
ncbi:MAG TPA: archease [Candidatus Acidoferrales bacterium]|nr:archease [Candidatus Acidoferrales bacterium]